MPTTRIFPLQEFSDVTSALPDIVRFLINDHPTITGPGWTIVEAFDGSTREIPSDSSDIDTFSAGFGWRTSSLSAGDWIVLESANANNTNHFQLYIELESTTEISFMLIPFEDFSTGGSAISPPLFTTSSFGNSSGTFVSFTAFNSSAQYTVAADEGMMALLADQTGSNTPYFTYFGEIDAVHIFENFDNRCYVVRTTTGDVGHTDSIISRWRRLSPIDSKTILNGYPAQHYSFGENSILHDTNAERGNLLGLDSIFPVGIWFSDPSHFAGYLRNCYSANENLPEASGTLSGSNYLHRRNQPESNIVLKFDGSTVFGRDSSGSLLEPLNHRDFLFSGSYSMDVDFNNTRLWGVTGSVTTLIVPEPEPEPEPILTNVVDKNRLRITYPSRRGRPVFGNLS